MSMWPNLKPYILLSGDLHHFIESPPTIIPADGITLVVANMVISGNEYADRIGT